LIQTLIRNWWLLAICGVLDAIISVIYFMMYDASQDAMPSPGLYAAAVLSNRLALAAGVCAIAAGIWRSAKGISWLLVLNGLAFGTYGLIPLVWSGPHGFRLFALLIVAMAMTFGVLALAIARALRHHVADAWVFGLAGAGSVGVALAFLALVSGWIPLERWAFHPPVFLWICCHFGFSAICMLGLALRLHMLGPSPSGQWVGNPKHAH